MSVRFFHQREFPSELQRLGGFAGDGDAQAVADIFGHLTQGVVGVTKAASPWDMLTGIFVDKPKAEAAYQTAQAELAAHAIEAQQAQRQQTLRTVLLVGGGVVALLAVALVLRPRKAVAGYRRRRRARR